MRGLGARFAHCRLPASPTGPRRSLTYGARIMATPQTPLDPNSPSISMIRRRLISATSEGAAADPRSETVDFDSLNGSPLQPDLERSLRAPSPGGYDEVEARLQRYQAEKGGPVTPLSCIHM